MPLKVEQPSQHVTLITIDNQPKRNAMSRQMLEQLASLWDDLDQSSCRCVVLTGAGEKAFCAGADLGGDLTASEETARIVNRALIKNSTFSKPIIAAVNGDCAGGGVELLLSTDIRVAAPHARFGLPEVRWSIYPFGGATVKLVQQIGYVNAMDLLLTGRLVDAGFAQSIGLVNKVVATHDVLATALETAQEIAANSPSAVQAVKQQISATIAAHTMSREALEQQLGDRVRASPEFTEGVAAFREKRRPDYG
ncbi:MAG: enoyl-CoA hydratase [Gammaproteobacteria bacterium]|jgi:enoyl-CoA hydratase